MAASYSFRGGLWQYPGQAGWHFITLPRDLAEEIRDDAGPLRKAFGSIKVNASIAGQRWSTSIFPDSESSSYLLPVKKALRTAAGLRAGDEVDVELELQFDSTIGPAESNGNASTRPKSKQRVSKPPPEAAAPV